MCYVNSARDVRSLGDLQVLVSDMVYRQKEPFSFESIKQSVLEVISDHDECGIQNVASEVDAILFSTLDALMRRKLVSTLGQNRLQNIG